MSALDLASAIRSGERSAVDVIDEHLARIDARDGEINAFNLVTADAAREAAAAVDAAVAAGNDPGPLAGVPIAIKDNMCTTGVATTCSSKILEGWEPPYDATVVHRGVAAGAAVGKHYAGLLPRMIEDIDVPYFVLTRANEWLEAWQNVSGIGSNRPETIVACAILCAHNELRSHPRFKNYSLSEITAEHLRKAPSCGVTADTILKTKEKLPSAPPATSLLWPQATQQAKPSSIPTPAPLA